MFIERQNEVFFNKMICIYQQLSPICFSISIMSSNNFHNLDKKKQKTYLTNRTIVCMINYLINSIQQIQY